MKVVVDATTDQVGKALAEQMVSDLNSIGYKASTQLLSSSVQYNFVQNSSNSGKWNVGYSQWFQDYPAASDFLNVLLGCGTIHPNSDASPNIAAFCQKNIQSQINQAEVFATTNPSEAARLWTQIDREDTNAAPSPPRAGSLRGGPPGSGPPGGRRPWWPRRGGRAWSAATRGRWRPGGCGATASRWPRWCCSC